jgi:hypothetical protein
MIIGDSNRNEKEVLGAQKRMIPATSHALTSLPQRTEEAIVNKSHEHHESSDNHRPGHRDLPHLLQRTNCSCIPCRSLTAPDVN